MAPAREPVDTHGDRYGNAFLLSDAPDNRLPDVGMPGVDAMRLLGEELVLDGIPWRNLATFVTTWMEPEAQRIIVDSGIHSARMDMPPPTGQPRLSDANVLPVDLDLIEEKGRELKARFSEIFQ